MAVGKMLEKQLLLDKFRGCMIGAVIGDCIGAPFECQFWNGIDQQKIDAHFSRLKLFERNLSNLNEKNLTYTDDTAMARQVALSLIHCNGNLDPADLAKKFFIEYFDQPERGYGGSVTKVFEELRDTFSQKNYLPDPYEAASHQFDGEGSYGNGAAMRVHPIGLVAKNINQVMEMSSKSARITHAHLEGIGGAIFQATSIQMALNDVEPSSILSQMTSTMSTQERFLSSLEIIKRFLITNNPTESRNCLGNDISAVSSVPTALFALLFSLISKSSDYFEATLKEALRFGGDSDTICSMAGALAGAKWGETSIPFYLLHCCEGIEEARNQANQLFHCVYG